MKAALLFLVCLWLPGPPVRAQQWPIGTRVGNDTTATAGESGYDDGGRRDPFLTLLVQKKAVEAPAGSPVQRKAGLAGASLADISVKGIVHLGSITVAVLQGPGGKSFVARTKDRLNDATIQAIDPDGVTFGQQVVGASGEVHTHAVRKTLRPAAAEEHR